jgi:hypothetical protein
MTEFKPTSPFVIEIAEKFASLAHPASKIVRLESSRPQLTKVIAFSIYGSISKTLVRAKKWADWRL